MIEISLGLGIFVSAIATLASTFLFFNYKNYSKRKKLRIIVFTELINLKNALTGQNEMFKELENDYEQDFEEILEKLNDSDHSTDIFYRKSNFLGLTNSYKNKLDVLTETELYHISMLFTLFNQREQGIQDELHTLENEGRLVDIISLTIETLLNQIEIEEEKLLSWSTLGYLFDSNSRMKAEKLYQLKKRME